MQNDMDIQIKQLNSSEVSFSEDLARILISAWQSGFRDILPEETIEKYTQFTPCCAMFRHILTSGVGTMYLAKLDDKSVGLLYWLPEGDSFRIEALLTVPEVWGTGVAAALIERTLADAGGSVTVWPFAKNHRARRFYEKHGFTTTGNTRKGDAEEVEYVHPHQEIATSLSSSQ